MFGLEGSGFILSVGLTLLIAGTIVFYVNNKFKETAEQLQTVLQIVQQVNSTRNVQPPVVPGTYAPPPLGNEHQMINQDKMNKDDLISVSDDSDDDDDDDSDVSSTTDIEECDEGEINNTKNIVVNVDNINNKSLTASGEDSVVASGTVESDDAESDDAESDDAESDDAESDDAEEHVNGIKNIDIDNASGGELDSMLLNIIDIHKNSTQETNLQDMKVTDLRELIKERGIKVSNLGKLKKNDCIQLLS